MDGQQREAWAKQVADIFAAGGGDACHKVMKLRENLGLPLNDFALVIDSALKVYIAPEDLQAFLEKYHLVSAAQGFAAGPLSEYMQDQVNGWVSEALASEGGIALVQFFQIRDGVDDFTIAAALTAAGQTYTAEDWLAYCEANPLNDTSKG